MFDRMPGLILRKGGIRRLAKTRMAKYRVCAGMFRVAIVRVNDVARGAAASAKISGMIVGARKGQHRIDQPSLLQAKKNRIRSQPRAEAPVAELVVRLAGFTLASGIPNFGFLAASTLEDPQHVAGL